jgi:hypothetical protein
VAQPNSFVEVNKATTPSKKNLATYEFLVEDAKSEAVCVESEAVTLTDSAGNEVLGPKADTDALPVVVALQASTLQLGHETPVSAVAVLVLPANPMREAGLVQNTGSANIRVGPAGVTVTTGYRLVPNQTILYIQPNVNQDAIWAIREGAIDSVAFAEEETIAWPGAEPPVVPCPPVKNGSGNDDCCD